MSRLVLSEKKKKKKTKKKTNKQKTKPKWRLLQILLGALRVEIVAGSILNYFTLYFSQKIKLVFSETFCLDFPEKIKYYY